MLSHIPSSCLVIDYKQHLIIFQRQDLLLKTSFLPFFFLIKIDLEVFPKNIVVSRFI